MARTVVYEDPLVAAHYAEAVAANPAETRAERRAARDVASRKAAENRAPGAAGKVALAEADTKDSYLSKLSKYVPAEVLSLALLVFAAFDPGRKAIWPIVIAGALITAGYLLSVAVTSSAPKPRWFFYLLAAAAFVGWAIATIDPVARRIGITGDNAETQKFAVLAITAFVIPALDPILNYLDIRFRSPPARLPD
jgi:hypothetical protein